MAIENNIKAARGTYGSFIGVVKWGAIGVAIVAVLVVFLITR